MRIVALRAYRVELPLVEGAYRWANGKSVETFDSTLVELETDDGRVGVGEACPLGPAYLPAFAGGVRAGLAELGPALLGADPTEPAALYARMDEALMGHPYVKSAVDMAAWDLLGQAAGLSVCALLGGRFGESVELYRAISQSSPSEMAERVAGYRSEGYRRFQLKVGGDPAEDVARIRAVAALLNPNERLVADANCGWLPHEAMRVLREIQDLDVYVEQPCRTYEECLAVRRACAHPFVLDECIDSIPALLRAIADRAMDVANLKISKFGGISRLRLARDLCVEAGVAMTIEDTWGGDVATAAIAHLAHSTPERFRFSSTDFNSYVTRSIADGAPRRANGRMAASREPGLGVRVRRAELGPPEIDLAR